MLIPFPILTTLTQSTKAALINFQLKPNNIKIHYYPKINVHIQIQHQIHLLAITQAHLHHQKIWYNSQCHQYKNIVSINLIKLVNNSY